MHLAPPPNARDLLPPLLSCLPAAFVSPQPPPALLPLLAPILRQRVSFLASSSGQSGNEGWLALLSWDKGRAAKLPAVIGRMELEPHPVSGEIELDDVRPAKYRRLDDETLQSRLEVAQFGILPVYVWCESDEHGGTGPGWKLAELRSLEDVEDGTEWCDTPAEANDAADTHSIPVSQTNGHTNGHSDLPTAADDEDNDNDDYWASYDRTPGRTPAPQASPAPHTTSTNRQRTQSELEYFARYGAEVQPAMDAHDPDEEHPELHGDSTLTGDALVRDRSRQMQQQQTHLSSAPPYHNHNHHHHPQKTGPHDSAIATALDQSIHSDLSMPRPISPTSSHSSVDRLEERAAAMEGGGTDDDGKGDDRAQLGIKQHISTDIKSLFRLAKSVGMERQEFERIVTRELSVLSLLEQDE